MMSKKDIMGQIHTGKDRQSHTGKDGQSRGRRLAHILLLIALLLAGAYYQWTDTRMRSDILRAESYTSQNRWEAALGDASGQAQEAKPGSGSEQAQEAKPGGGSEQVQEAKPGSGAEHSQEIKPGSTSEYGQEMESAHASEHSQETELSAASPTVQAVRPEYEERVNLNTASSAELEQLPGIGPAIARSIIEYREAHGGFRHIEEIKEVKRIGDKTFEKLKNLISVR